MYAPSMYAPLLIAGLLATGAGTGMQIAGNSQAQSALGAERAREAQQQAEFRSKAEGDVNASLAQSTPAVAQAQQQGGTANRLSMFQALKSAGAPLTAPTTTPTGNAIIGGGPSAQASTVAGGASNAWQNLMAGAQAREGGMSDWENQQGVKNALTMGNLGAIGTQASDAASIYPIEQQVALQKGDSLNGWGSLLSMLGGLSMMGAAVMPAGAAGAGTSTPFAFQSAGIPGDAGAGIYGGGAGINQAGFIPVQSTGWSALTGGRF